MNDKDDIEIGSFSLDEFLNEETIGKVNIKKLGDCTVHVYSGEGKIPHVHVISKNGDFETCVCLNTNKHFIHGKYTDKFTNGKQRKAFDKFMNSKSKENPDMTNWEVSSMAWNLSNVDALKIQWQNNPTPDYKNMTDEAIVETAKDAELRKNKNKR